MARILVLFVHGLGGGLDTWGRFKELLEGDADLSGRISVATYVYPTKLINFWPFWKSSPLQDLARGLATEIRTRYSAFSKILLVSHSLGGLVAKRYIIDCIKKHADLPVREVIFFATPHHGADLASIASLFSIRHYHLKQLIKESDLIEGLNEDWALLKCEAEVGTTYVVAGQDNVVSRTSAGIGIAAEVIPNKDHRDTVKPRGTSDIAFLLVKQAALRMTGGIGDDLLELNRAIHDQNGEGVSSLLINRGRSWIETPDVERALELLRIIEERFEPESIQAVWSHYLTSIANLFRNREAPATAFDDTFLSRAEPYDLRPLVLAERMEFARQRRDTATLLDLASNVEAEIPSSFIVRSPTEAYALGVACFFLGNFYRAGGKYRDASIQIGRAKSFYRPPIWSHQVELAHCQYGLAICRAMTGGSDDFPTAPLLGLEMRRFSTALRLLANSHSAWAKNQLGDAIDYADAAADIFRQIRFIRYGAKAKSLATLLETWRRLELGVSADVLTKGNAEDTFLIAAMLGDEAQMSRFRDWVPNARPSRVVGLLQFASAYNQNWTKDVGWFNLPPIVKRTDDGKLQWVRQGCRSLAEGHSRLRDSMDIAHDSRLPLLAD